MLDDVLALINDEELIGIWSEDETIGWVYQYFTPKELRDQARKESQAPRNSYELAFRNQFFTPRYVVEFLTDNTLGHIWYEMRKGDTKLKDKCLYMVRRPTEIFLNEGESPPKNADVYHGELSQEDLLKQSVYIFHRPKKDPRDLRILDPACGSGHFLLYCFILLQTIYDEAYDDPELGPALQRDYPTLDDLRRAVPGLILSRNLHGIDIDIRATQIGALALWFRCQRAYQEIGLQKDRPKITRSNIVCAEPMPGETDILKEFVTELQPKVLGQLVEVIFDKMKLAGDAGSLLKIEEEIADAIAEAKKQWLTRPKAEQLALWPEEKRLKAEQLGLFDVSDITDEEFWHDAEARVLDALYKYAQRVSNVAGLRRQLFAEDAIHGFAFVDVCRKQFDVVLMNPPFGEFPHGSLDYLKTSYKGLGSNIAGLFLARSVTLLARQGLYGFIGPRALLFLQSTEGARKKALIEDAQVELAADLGLRVMDDAWIEACAMVVRSSATDVQTLFIRLLDEIDKELILKQTLCAISLGEHSNKIRLAYVHTFLNYPNNAISYWLPISYLRFFEKNQTFEQNYGTIRQGLATADDFRYLRLFPEVSIQTIGSTYY